MNITVKQDKQKEPRRDNINNAFEIQEQKFNDANEKPRIEANSHTIQIAKNNANITVNMPNIIDYSWINQSKEDISLWSRIIEIDRIGNKVKWDWLESLDYRGGVSKLSNASIDDIIALNDEDALHYLKEDLKIFNDLTALYERAKISFMFDSKRIVSKYDYMRAVAFATTRIKDEIDIIMLTHDTDDINDYYDETMYDFEDLMRNQGKYESQTDKTSKPAKPRSMRYLPGQDVNTVIGVDIETTGLHYYSDYLIDIGYEKMEVSPLTPVLTHENMVNATNYPYTENYYETAGAYDAHRQMFGVNERRQYVGNPAEYLNGLKSEHIYDEPAFDVNMTAQHEILNALMSAPYVAHNARFEHPWFTAKLKGYAEAYRDGRITYIDTMYMSWYWDDKPRKNRDNTLELYAKRHGIINEDNDERHLGLEDTHIMLLAMKQHLKALYADKQGPWNPDDPIIGVGGKTVPQYS